LQRSPTFKNIFGHDFTFLTIYYIFISTVLFASVHSGESAVSSTGTVGSVCEMSDECSASVVGPVYCHVTSAGARGQCRCPTGYRPSDDRLACVVRRLAEPCHVDADCRAASTVGTACIGGRCACVVGRVAVSPTTCRLRRPGDLCAVYEATQYCHYFYRTPEDNIGPLRGDLVPNAVQQQARRQSETWVNVSPSQTKNATSSQEMSNYRIPTVSLVHVYKFRCFVEDICAKEQTPFRRFYRNILQIFSNSEYKCIFTSHFE